MNESMNLPKLISSLATAADCNPELARKFIHDFFELVVSSLQLGESVKIKGVGEFVKTDYPECPVKFLADKELADAANEPFAAFSAIELDDDITEADLDNIDASITQAAPEPQALPKTESTTVTYHSEVTPEPTIAKSEEETDDIKDEPKVVSLDADDKVETTPQPEQIEEAVVLEYDEDENAEENHPYPSQNGKLKFVIGLLIGLIIGLIAGYFLGVEMSRNDIALTQLNGIEEPLIAKPDTATDTIIVNTESQSLPEEVALPKLEAVYDTVGRTRFLTTMALAHYGYKNYWVFIYQANPNLGNPNRIAPGTKILIPPLESFKEANTEETLEKAQRIQFELVNKYNN